MILRKLCFIALLSSMLFCVKASANDYYGNDCCPQTDCDFYCDPCSDWGVYAEYIYWRARRCELDYAIPYEVSLNTSRGSVQDISLNYDSGFKIGVTKGCGSFYLDIFYTYFRNNESDSIFNANGQLSATRVPAFSPSNAIIPGSTTFLVKGKWELDYDTLDVLMGYKLCNSSCFDSYIFGGFKYASIDQEFKTGAFGTDTFDTNSEFTKQTIDVDAYGINFGLGARYDFCGCFNLFGRTSVDLLLADVQRSYSLGLSSDGGTTIFETIVNLHDDCWRTVGVLNLAIGLGYDYTFTGCCCADLGISIGYEIHQWSGLPDFLEYEVISHTNILSANTTATLERHLQSLGFDGLFLRVSLGF